MSYYQHHNSWYHNVPYPPLLLKHQYHRKGTVKCLAFILYATRGLLQKAKLRVGFTLPPCGQCLWSLLVTKTCSTSYGSILKLASPSLGVFFSSVSLSGLTVNKGEITQLNYQHRRYTNFPCIVFPTTYFYLGLKSSTLRCVFLACSLGLGSQTREGAVTCRMTWTFAKQKHTTTLLLGCGWAVSACVPLNQNTRHNTNGSQIKESRDEETGGRISSLTNLHLFPNVSLKPGFLRVSSLHLLLVDIFNCYCTLALGMMSSKRFGLQKG